MLSTQQTPQTNSSSKNRLLNKENKNFVEKDGYQKAKKKLYDTPDISSIENDRQRMKKKELAHADLIEQSIIGKITFLIFFLLHLP